MQQMTDIIKFKNLSNNIAASFAVVKFLMEVHMPLYCAPRVGCRLK
jgi:hypothetical protein